MSGIGHNSEAETFARDLLRSLVERIERLHEERKALADDVRDVFAEAKAHGFDVKAMRAVIRMRSQDAAQRQEHEAILRTYMAALGMVPEDGGDALAHVPAREAGDA